MGFGLTVDVVLDLGPLSDLIWGPDLQIDNALLCRVTVEAGQS